MKNGYIYSANVDVYYPDIKFVYDTTKIEMSQYYFDCYYIRNNSKYNITFCRDAVSCLDQAYEWFSKKASGDMTVSQWKQNRFYPYYPGLEVDVLDVVGITLSGQTKLKNVINTYKDE